MKHWPIILAASILSACTSDPSPNTPSGNLEITVPNTRPDCVRSEAVKAIQSHGFKIDSTANGRIIAGYIRPEDGFEERITVLFLPQYDTNTLKIVVYPDLVKHPGTDFESYKTIRPTQFGQNQLNMAKEKIQTNCSHR
jgi:hypothetical protein